MARKKLNKKVAFIGLIIICLIAVVGIWAVLSLGKDPDKFLADAKVALEEKDFKNADRAYQNAYGCSKTLEQRIGILFDMADLALIEDPGDAEQEREPKQADWKRAIGIWKNVTLSDINNIPARKNILDFYYEAADSGQTGAWDQVRETSSEIIEILEESEQEPDISVIMARGRAELENILAGKATDPEESLKETRVYLEKAKLLQPENMNIYLYLAKAEIEQGKLDNMAGKINAIEKSENRALGILQEAIEAYPENPIAYVNILNLKLDLNRTDFEKVEALEPEYKAVMEKFPQSSEVFNTAATYYQLSIKTLDKAVECSEKAIALDPQNIENYKLAASTYYRYGKIYDIPQYIEKAISVATKALELPESQETTGPRSGSNANNRLICNSLLAKFYIEQSESATDEQVKAELITKAEAYVHEIEQMIGVGENRNVLKWKGMLELAKGNRDEAVVLLYSAFKKYETTPKPDADLSYALAKIYINSPYKGATQRFLNSALRGNIVQQGKPDVALEFAQIYVDFEEPQNAIKLVEQYEKIFGTTEESIRIKTEAFIIGKFFEKAQEAISNIENPATKTKLSIDLAFAQLTQFRQMQVTTRSYDYSTEIQDKVDELESLIRELLTIDKQMVDYRNIAAVANNHIAAGNIQRATDLVNIYIEAFPDDVSARILAAKLVTGQPDQLSIDEIKEITLQVLEQVEDPLAKDMGLAQYYRGIGDYDTAKDTLKELIDNEQVKTEATTQLFDLAIITEDYDLAQDLTDKARKENIDRCQGNFFNAKLNLAMGNYDETIAACSNCIKLQPIFPAVHSTMSLAHENLGNLELAIESAQEAYLQDPLDKDIARQKASILYKRNLELGKTATPSQISETQKALIWAMKLDPANLNLQSIYAEYIYDTDPRRALAIRQALQKSYPNVQNALLLGNMAVKIAKTQTSPQARVAIFDVAEAAYNEALAIEPGNESALNAYSEYLRITGQEEKIEELLAGKEEVLWKAYIRGGKYKKAEELLNTLYSKDPENIQLLKGLLLVAQKTLNSDNVIRYTQDLIEIEDNSNNRLAQIQAYLELGMVEETEAKIAEFKDMFPEETKIQMFEASLLIRKGMFDQALSAINMALEKDRSDALALQLRAQINNLRGDYNRAIEDLAKAKTLSDDPTIRQELAKAYARADRIDQAITELTIAIDENQAPLGAQSLLEQLHNQSGNNAKLQKFYESMIAQDPENSYWSNRLADLLAKMGEIDQALEIYLSNWNKAIKAESSDIQALMGYLNTLIESERYNEAISFASNLTDSPFATGIYNILGQAKAGLGDKENAKRYFTTALEKAGINRIAIGNTLNSASEILTSDEIEQIYSDMLSSDPESLNANMIAFSYLINEKQYNKAISYIDRCIESSKNEDLKNAFMRNKADVLQLAYLKMPNEEYLKNSIQIYQQLLEASPSDVAILNNLAYMLASNKIQLDEALKYAEKSYAMMPGNGTILDTYAYVLLQMGKAEEALKLLLRSVQLFELGSLSAPGDVYEHLGQAYEELDKIDEALAAYQRALESQEAEIDEHLKKRVEAAVNRLIK